MQVKRRRPVLIMNARMRENLRIMHEESALSTYGISLQRRVFPYARSVYARTRQDPVVEIQTTVPAEQTSSLIGGVISSCVFLREYATIFCASPTEAAATDMAAAVFTRLRAALRKNISMVWTSTEGRCLEIANFGPDSIYIHFMPHTGTIEFGATPEPRFMIGHGLGKDFVGDFQHAASKGCNILTVGAAPLIRDKDSPHVYTAALTPEAGLVDWRTMDAKTRQGY